MTTRRHAGADGTRYSARRAVWGDKPWRHNYFRISASVQQYHYPLAVLDDGKILVWVDMACALKAYDPETSAWTDLAKLGGGSVVGLHHGSLLCSNLGAAQA